MSQKRQLEDALAAVERAGSGNTFEPIRNYLQLVRAQEAFLVLQVMCIKS